MQPFVYNARPARVIFGSGTLSQLPAEVERLGLERVLVLATSQQEAGARDLASRLGQRSAGARDYRPGSRFLFLLPALWCCSSAAARALPLA